MTPQGAQTPVGDNHPNREVQLSDLGAKTEHVSGGGECQVKIQSGGKAESQKMNDGHTMWTTAYKANSGQRKQRRQTQAGVQQST